MYIFFFSSVTLIHAFCLAVHWLPSASFCINHPLKLTHSVLIMFLHWFQCPTNISPLDLPLKFEEWNNWFQRGFFEGILFPHLTLLERFDFKIYVTFCSIYLHILEKYNFLMLLSQSKHSYGDMNKNTDFCRHKNRQILTIDFSSSYYYLHLM